jgi:hypothetical protein
VLVSLFPLFFFLLIISIPEIKTHKLKKVNVIPFIGEKRNSNLKQSLFIYLFRQTNPALLKTIKKLLAFQMQIVDNTIVKYKYITELDIISCDIVLVSK